MPNDSVGTIDPHTLHSLLCASEELALLDAREELTFSQSHILYASCLPLSRLECLASKLVPRRGAPIVVCDDGEAGGLGSIGLAARAAARLAQLGYQDVRVLAGGTAAWAVAGFELFSGVNVPSKAFGEYVEHRYQTPSISADELKAMQEANENMVILDSRPSPEFRRESIPGGRCVPGAELAYRVHDLAPSAQTTVVVNCAGRTRSIIGAQSLINAGIANRVVALRNGTMGWHLAGFEVQRGAGATYGEPSEAGLAKAQSAADTVARRFGVRTLDQATFERWQDQSQSRSLFVFDVRSPEEFEAGHLPGTRSAPGGQLVQETDMFVGTLRARIVLVDDTGVRARMTGSWLAQMGWPEVAVLDQASAGTMYGGELESGPEPQVWLGASELSSNLLEPGQVRRVIGESNVDVLDLSLSRNYKAGHIAGAQYAVRARLGDVMDRLKGDGPLILVCEDGWQARFAAGGLAEQTARPVYAMDGGMSAWSDSGFPVEVGGETWADHPDDVWLKPFERGIGLEEAMQEYLTWEVALVAQLERDGTARFQDPGDR